MLGAVVIGEALVDVVETSPGERAEVVGGSPLNVAVTLARLGIDTVLVTALGDDRRADAIEEHLAASGVRTLSGRRRLPRTSTAAARLGPDGAAEYDFDVDWDIRDEPLPASSIVHAGSIGLFLQPGADAVRRHVERASGGALVSLDPNIRPAFLPDRAAAVRAFEGLVAVADVVKLSEEDAAWLYPGLDEEGVRDRLLGLGAGLVGITRGGAGCVLASNAAVVEAPAPPTTVVDTIGAGDSFMGGLLRHLLASGLAATMRSGGPLGRDELAGTADFALRVAAATVARRGANPPLLSELSV